METPDTPKTVPLIPKTGPLIRVTLHVCDECGKPLAYRLGCNHSGQFTPHDYLLAVQPVETADPEAAEDQEG